MNPLLIPDSCRTKGIHPPGTSREDQHRDLADVLVMHSDDES